MTTRNLHISALPQKRNQSAVNSVLLRSLLALAWLVIGLFLIGNKSAHAVTIDDPFSYFNVYSLNNISYSGSDFEGKAGAAGNVSLNNFSLALKDQGGYALHAGGAVTFTKGTFYGGLEAGKAISVGGIGINGDVHGGADVSNTVAGGTINGYVYAAGTANLDSHITYYSKTSGVAYNPEADLEAISSYFANFSTLVGGMSNTGSISNSYGTLSLTAVSGINVFSLSAADMYAASTVKITGVSDAIVYINVTGTSASLNWTGWQYSGGITADDVLLNYADATLLNMTSSNYVNILAPFADTSFTGGVVTGNLIVGNLRGSGQVNLGHFSHGPQMTTVQMTSVPEPASIFLMCTGLIGLTGLRLAARRPGLSHSQK